MQIKYEYLTVKNINIHVLLKNSIFLGGDSYNIMIFFQNFIQKYDF